MTKKDYINFAEMFVDMYSNATEITEEQIIGEFVEKLTDILYQDNDRFDYQRFNEYIAKRRTGNLVVKTT